MLREATSFLPSGSFFTGGADETVRVWSLERKSDENNQQHKGNMYSRELKSILYFGQGTDSLSEQPDKNFGNFYNNKSTLIGNQISGGIMSDTLDSTIGVRCLRISHNVGHLACGSRAGNIMVFDLSSKQMNRVVEFEAHDSEVLCLEYSDPSKCNK